MPTREPSDPFGSNESMHLLWKHLLDYVSTTFDNRPLPAHVEQYLMLFMVGEIDINFLKESMVQSSFSDRNTAETGLKEAIKQWKTEQSALIDRVGKGDYWSKGV